MLIIILLMAILVIGLCGFLIGQKLYARYANCRIDAHKLWMDARPGSKEGKQAYKECLMANEKMEVSVNIKNGFCILLVSAIIMLSVCGIVLGIIYIEAQNDRLAMIENYNMLNAADDVVKPHDSSLHENAQAYNYKIQKNRYWNSNPWTNWFIPDFYDELPLYEYSTPVN